MFIYLLEMMHAHTHTVKKRELFHLLVYSSRGHNGEAWARLMLQASRFIRVLHVGAQGPRPLGASSTAFLGRQ